MGVLQDSDVGNGVKASLKLWETIFGSEKMTCTKMVEHLEAIGFNSSYQKIRNIIFGGLSTEKAWVYLLYHTWSQVLYGGVAGSIMAIAWFAFTQEILTPLFPRIAAWPISEFFLIRDTSLIPNILWFEYTVTRAEARVAVVCTAFVVLNAEGTGKPIGYKQSCVPWDSLLLAAVGYPDLDPGWINPIFRGTVTAAHACA
ncbi:hypothetical protein WISP_85583 [Willisornis vidua]|uniref:Uncharacterized protein n=1 Tax=Willisornis vidua TaxID=1566151 RepID=A0ABQ9D7U0_9PASS|nr:hypothetical protein WISP_85583 [Willisornis vidua]